MARKRLKPNKKDVRSRRREYTVHDPIQEQQVDAACKWLDQRKKFREPLNIKEASRKFGVKYHILRSHYSRTHKPLKEARADQQTLSPGQENIVKDWICYLGAMGLPLGISELHRVVEVVSGQLPSKQWVYHFRNRHSELLFRRAASLDPKRGSAFNKMIVKDCFDKISDLFNNPNKYAKFFEVPDPGTSPQDSSSSTSPSTKIPCDPLAECIEWMTKYNPANRELMEEIMPKNIASYDEKACAMGGGRGVSAGKFIYGRIDRAKCKVKDANLELVTVCVRADGTALPPGFIFSGGGVQPSWARESPDGNITIASSPNRWTDDDLCLEHFRVSIIPQMQAHADPKYPIVIFFDGHGSHVTVRMIELARKCGVHLFCLPPHTTHKLQPLDVGVFGPLQRAWRKNCEEFSAVRGRGISKPEFVKEYMKVREDTFTPELITTAWRKTGLYPLNPGVFTEFDYSPSQMTSTTVHYPPSFPISFTLGPSNEAHSTPPIPLCPDPHPDCDREDEEFSCEEMTTPSPSNHSDSRSGSPEGNAQGLSEQSPIPGTSPPPTAADSHLGTSPPPTPPPSALLDPAHTPVYHLIIPQPSQPEPLVDTTAPIDEQLVAAVAQAQYWQERASTLQNQLEMNNVHFAFSVRENDHLRKKLYAKSEPKDPRSQALKCQARLLTTDEVMDLEMERAAEKAEKERKRLKKQDEKHHEEAERARMRDMLGRDIRFTKPLKRMLRSELNDVIAVMSLPCDQKNAQECIRTIEAHVEKYPDLKVDPRFGRIFNGRYTTPPPPGPENIPPPVPETLYRFDTPKLDLKTDEPSIGGSRSLNPSIMHSPSSSSALSYRPMSYTFPPSVYGYPPSVHSYFPSSYDYPTSSYTLPSSGVQLPQTPRRSPGYLDHL